LLPGSGYESNTDELGEGLMLIGLKKIFKAVMWIGSPMHERTMGFVEIISFH